MLTQLSANKIKAQLWEKKVILKKKIHVFYFLVKHRRT